MPSRFFVITEKPSSARKIARARNNTCRVCHHDKIEDSVFCIKHSNAYNKLKSGFQQWRYALGYQWLEYLEKLDEISGTGEYIKEMLDNILAMIDP